MLTRAFSLLILIGLFAPTPTFCPPKKDACAGAGRSLRKETVEEDNSFLTDILVALDRCIDMGGKFKHFDVHTTGCTPEQCKIAALVSQTIMSGNLKAVATFITNDKPSFIPRSTSFIIGFIAGSNIDLSSRQNSKNALKAAETLYNNLMPNPCDGAARLTEFATGIMQGYAYNTEAHERGYALKYFCQAPAPGIPLPLISITPSAESRGETLEINLAPLAEMSIDKINEQRTTAHCTGTIRPISHTIYLEEVTEYIGMHVGATAPTHRRNTALPMGRIEDLLFEDFPTTAPTDSGDRWKDAHAFFGTAPSDTKDWLPDEFDGKLDDSVRPIVGPEENDLEAFCNEVLTRNPATPERISLQSCNPFLVGFIAGIENSKLEDAEAKKTRFNAAISLYTIFTERKLKGLFYNSTLNPCVLDGFIEGHQAAEDFPNICVEWWKIHNDVSDIYTRAIKKQTTLEDALRANTTLKKLIQRCKGISDSDTLKGLSNTICQSISLVAGFLHAQPAFLHPTEGFTIRPSMNEALDQMVENLRKSAETAEEQAALAQARCDQKEAELARMRTKAPQEKTAQAPRIKDARAAAQQQHLRARLEERRKLEPELRALQQEVAASTTTPKIDPAIMAAQLIAEEERAKATAADKAAKAKNKRKDKDKDKDKDKTAATGTAAPAPTPVATSAAPRVQAAAQPIKAAPTPPLTKKQLREQKVEEARKAAEEIAAQEREKARQAKIAADKIKKEQKKAAKEAQRALAEEALRRQEQERIAAERQAQRIRDEEARLAAEQAAAKEQEQRTVSEMAAKEGDKAYDSHDHASADSTTASSSSTPPDSATPQLLSKEEFIKRSYDRGIADGKNFFQSPATYTERKSWISNTQKTLATMAATHAPEHIQAYNAGLLHGYAYQHGFLDGSTYSESNQDPFTAGKCVADMILRLAALSPLIQDFHYHKGFITGYNSTEAKKFAE